MYIYTYIYIYIYIYTYIHTYIHTHIGTSVNFSIQALHHSAIAAAISVGRLQFQSAGGRWSWMEGLDLLHCGPKDQFDIFYT